MSSTTAVSPPSPAASPRFRIDWRTEALVLALAVAEAAIVWLIADLILGAAEGDTVHVPVLAVGSLVILGSGLPRWLDAIDVWDRVYATTIVAGVVISTAVAIKLASFPQFSWGNPDWLREAGDALVLKSSPAVISVWGVVIVSALAWWRGRTRSEPGSDEAMTILRLGTIAVLVAAAGQASAREDSGGTTSAAVVIFFGAALAAISLSRLRAEGTSATAGLSSRWLGAMLAPVLAVTVGAIFVAGLLSRDLLDTILWFLSPVIWTVSLLVRGVILLLALIAFIILSPLLWLLSRHPIDFAGVRLAPAEAPPEEQLQRAVEQSNGVPDAIRYLVAAAILLILFAGVTKLVMRRRRRPEAIGDEERSSVLDSTDLFGLLKSLLASRFRRSGPPDDPLAGLRGDPRWAHTVAIRETYGHFLTWSNERGQPRRASMTPSEHQRRWNNSASSADLATVTDLYNVTRYSETPATEAEANRVRTAWERLRGEPTP